MSTKLNSKKLLILAVLALLVAPTGCSKKKGLEQGAEQDIMQGAMDSEGSEAGKGVKRDAASVTTGSRPNLISPVTPAGVGSASVAQSDAADEEKAEKAPSCFTVTYKHKPVSSHSDDEYCGNHKNLVKLKHEQVNFESVCVRVDGTPVRFSQVKGKSDEILVASVAGPQAKITVRYCLNKEKCDEDCVIPKDEFMDAIGGEAPDGKVAQWDPSEEGADDFDANRDLEKAVKDELVKLDGSDRQRTKTFDGWLGDSGTVACTKKLAQKN